MKIAANKYSFWNYPPVKKAAKVTLTVLLTLAVLELGLRAGGFILSSLQEKRNLQAIKQTGRFRIMCLGESTTQNQYPPYLEDILNARAIGVKFSMIDKGLSGATTGILLSNVNEYLDKYKPDMVVAMMGCNDRPVLYYHDYQANTGIFRYFRLYRFARIICARILKKINHQDIYGADYDKNSGLKRNEITARKINLFELKHARDNFIALSPGNQLGRENAPKLHANPGKLAELERAFKQIIALEPGNTSAYDGLAWLYGARRRLTAAEQTFKEALKIDPGDSSAYEGLAWIFRDQQKWAESEKSFKTAIRLKPDNYYAYFELAWLYTDTGKFDEAEKTIKELIAINPHEDSAFQTICFYRDIGDVSRAEEVFKEAVSLNPENDFAYEGLGLIFRDQGKNAEAEENFRKAIKLNPKNLFAYEELGGLCGAYGSFSEVEQAFQKIIELNPKDNAKITYKLLSYLYLKKGKFAELERIFKKIIELAPDNDSAYAGLGLLYGMQKNFPASETAFKKALEINPENDSAIGGLAIRYQELGQSSLSLAYANKSANMRKDYSNPTTTINYRILKSILDKRKIKLVCVQYPMRSVLPLKDIFKGEPPENVIFVDNEKIFRDAVRNHGHERYFTDMFAGDFGHCTEEGNRLLAGNIADTIIKEFFNN